MASTVSGQTPLADGGGELPGPRGSTAPVWKAVEAEMGRKEGRGEGGTRAPSLRKELPS